MAVDMFLSLDGGKIKGESQDSTHTDEIDILAWSWGMSQSGSFHTGGGGGSGKANFQDINITKWIDRSSPLLALYCANGDHFETATLVIRKAGKKPLEYLKLEMKGVLVVSLSTGGSGGEDRLTENVSLNFKEVHVGYKQQKEDGSGDTPVEFKWNIAKNLQL